MLVTAKEKVPALKVCTDRSIENSFSVAVTAVPPRPPPPCEQLLEVLLVVLVEGSTPTARFAMLVRQ